jgi:hypothetical protein
MIVWNPPREPPVLKRSVTAGRFSDSLCRVPTPWLRFLFWAYLLFMVWASATATNPADPDLWHRLAIGEYLWQQHRFPLGDTFSYLSDYQHVADHEWGSAIIFYALWSWGAGTAMVGTKLITLTITLALVVWAGLQSRQPTFLFTAFYALVLLTLLPSFQSTVRCMIFTHIIFALWLYWFQRERHGRPVPTLYYVLSIVPWANLHGGFTIGLFWLGAVAVIEAILGCPWKIWLVRLGLCSLATLINPFGWHLWVSTARALAATRHGFNEWAPVQWWTLQFNYPGYKLLLVSVLIALAIQLYRLGWKNIDRTGVILTLLFMGLAISSARHTSLFAIVAGALVPDFFPLKWPYFLTTGPVRRLVITAASFALVLVPLFTGLLVLPGAGLTLEYPPVACPVPAVDFLQRANIRGNLLVPFNYGSYALWKLRGQMRVSMDGRYDLVYKATTYRRVDDFFVARGDWHRLLTSPAPDAILVPRSEKVYGRLRGEPGWIEAWVDPSDAVFVPASRLPAR